MLTRREIQSSGSRRRVPRGEQVGGILQCESRVARSPLCLGGQRHGLALVIGSAAIGVSRGLGLLAAGAPRVAGFIHAASLSSSRDPGGSTGSRSAPAPDQIFAVSGWTPLTLSSTPMLLAPLAAVFRHDADQRRFALSGRAAFQQPLVTANLYRRPTVVQRRNFGGVHRSDPRTFAPSLIGRAHRIYEPDPAAIMAFAIAVS